MVARNPNEKSEIENIVKTFKLAMHPNLTQGGNAKGLFLGYPLVWKIKPANSNSTCLVRTSTGTIERRYDGEELLKFLPSTDYCALTDVKVDYTPENNIAMLKSGFVQAVRITLSFTELITLTREDIIRLDYSNSN